MEINIINPHTISILIAAREKDSINAISRRISLSYGWTHKWINDLAKAGVFKLTRMRVYLNKDSEFYKLTLSYIKDTLGKNITFYYEALRLFGIKYCFVQTDSVFIWTRGGYNISRFKDFYPIFISVAKKDKEIFEDYCKKLGLHINKDKGIFYQVTYLEDFKFAYVDNTPVESLEDTISFMEKNRYNFEPAIEMINQIYGKGPKVKYKEATTNV